MPFNADDIIYSIDIQKATKGLGQYGVYQEWIKEVKKIDDLDRGVHPEQGESPLPTGALLRHAVRL